MELDNLKDAWKSLPAKNEWVADSDAQILALLQKKSRSPVAKMRRNLLIEFLLVVVVYSLSIGYYFIAWQGRLWGIAVMLLVIGVFFLFYYQRKNKLLKEMQCMVCEIRSNLLKQLETLEKYVRFYFISGTLLVPVSYFVAAWVVYITSSHKTDLLKLPAVFYFLFAGFAIAITIGSYFLNKWYVDKLYGRHIRKLRELLQQLD